MLLCGQISTEWHPELHLIGRELCRRGEFQGKIESFRHDADDLVALAIQMNYLADDLRVGLEAAAPKIVAEHENVRVTWPIIVR